MVYDGPEGNVQAWLMHLLAEQQEFSCKVALSLLEFIRKHSSQGVMYRKILTDSITGE